MTTTTLPLPVTQRAKLVRSSSAAIVIGFFAAHLLLAFLIRAVPMIGVAHVLGTATVGVLYAATTKNLRRVAMVLAYLAGCEVLWRMTKVGPFWEFAKYASVMILLV